MEHDIEVALAPIPEEESTALATPSAASRLDESTLMDFFTVDGLGRATRASAWTVDKELEILREIAENPDEPGKVRIAACDALRARQLQALRLSGRLAQILTEQRALCEEGPAPESTSKSLSVVQHTSLEMLRRFSDPKVVVEVRAPAALQEIPNEPSS